MKTVGNFLKSARIKKRYSLRLLESGTKIKKEFIAAMEAEDWASLPDFPVVAGFIKNISSFLGIDERTAYAFLKRDYPPQKLSVNPKPDVVSKFVWTPKHTFWIGIIVATAVTMGYLGFQYVKFTTAPFLEVIEPKEGSVAKTNRLTISGKTDPDATIKINNQAVLVGDDGEFNEKISIFEGTKEITVEAVSRSGKKTIIRRNIKPELP